MVIILILFNEKELEKKSEALYEKLVKEMEQNGLEGLLSKI